MSAKEREAYYRGEVAKLKREQQQLVDKIAASDDEMLFAALQDRFRDGQKELKVLEAKHAKCASNLAMPSKLFEHARGYLASPSKVWKNGDLKTRQTVLKVCLAEPLRYRRNQGFRTPKTTPIFSALAASRGSGSGLVEHSGIEPLTSCMPCRRSPS